MLLSHLHQNFWWKNWQIICDLFSSWCYWLWLYLEFNCDFGCIFGMIFIWKHSFRTFNFILKNNNPSFVTQLDGNCLNYTPKRLVRFQYHTEIRSYTFVRITSTWLLISSHQPSRKFYGHSALLICFRNWKIRPKQNRITYVYIYV